MTARERFAGARVARLATVGPDARPHLVPIVFAVDGDTIYTAVDGKPKRGTTLRRLTNIAANPQVSVLADDYSEDWDTLWWVRADGTARVLAPDLPPARRAVELLVARYRQYAGVPLPGPVIAIAVDRWTGWPMP